MKKIFRSVAGDGIRGLRSTKDVPEDAAEEEEAAMAVQQNLTAKQREEEPGQYGRLLRLYAGTFRGFNAIGEQSRENEIDTGRDGAGKENEIDTGKGGAGKGKVQQDKQAAAPNWIEVISDWAPIVVTRKTQGPQPPKGVNTKRGFHALVL